MPDNLQEEIEDKIMDLIALGAGRRLVVFKPEKSDPLRSEASKDLIVEKKSEYKDRIIFLNVYENRFPNSKDLVPEENFYLMFVRFDVVKNDIKDNFLVVPSRDFKKLGKDADFSRFLMSKKNFIRFLIDALGKK